MTNNTCFGEYDTDNPDCNSCSVLKSCLRKYRNITHRAYKNWMLVQEIRDNKDKLSKKLREKKAEVRHLAQKLGEMDKNFKLELDRYNKLMQK